MKMITENAKSEMVSLVHSLNKDPQTWQDWSCLHISFLKPLTHADDEQKLNCITSLLTACLKGIEGKSFFCDDGHIFIVCKNILHAFYQEIEQHILDLVTDDNTLVFNFKVFDFKVFDFKTESQKFVDYYFDENNKCDIFSLPKLDPDQDHIKLNNMLLGQEQDLSPAPNEKHLPKVLLVEDDPVTCWMVRNSLQSECEFATAQNGNKALSFYVSYQPDVVFLDINLPDLDGVSVLEWIMKHDPGAYIVMFSSEGQLDTMVSTLEGGAQGFISKPFRKDQLVHYLNSCPRMR